MSIVEVDRIQPVETYDLRARVLRGGDKSAAVASDDEIPGAWHLGAHRGSVLVGIASFYPRPYPRATGVAAVQLRFMAVDPSMQGRGVGSELLDHAIGELRQQRVSLLWANGRDTALDFYSRLGFTVVGDGFIHEPGLPHHLIRFDLSRELG